MYARRMRIYEIRRRHLPRRMRTWVRFYGKFLTKSGKPQGFEFQVRTNLSGKTVYSKVVRTVQTMKQEHLMPLHERRQTFPSFRALFAIPWVRIRRILDYDVTTEVRVLFR